ncbi:MAG: FG-GAP-like repeat-containing protein [Limisphaerales bacterium]
MKPSPSAWDFRTFALVLIVVGSAMPWGRAQAQGITSQPPLAHFRFDEGVGTTTADTRGTFIGQLSQGASFNADGIAGACLALNAEQSGTVNFGDVLPLTNTAFSISVWFKTPPGDTTPEAMIFSKHRPWIENGYYVLLNGGGGTVAGYGGLDAKFYTSATVNDGQWHHGVLVVTGTGEIRFHLDGGAALATAQGGSVVPSPADFMIGGADPPPPARRFNGRIDDVQIYEVALDGESIDFLHTHPGLNLAQRDFTSFQPEASPISAIRDQVYSASWGDYDRDDRPDLFLATLTGNGPILFRNQAAGFADDSNSLAADPTLSRAGAVWFDADNDGDLDLFVATTAAQADHLYLNLADGRFEEIADVAGATGQAFGQAMVVSDFDRDGKPDLFVANGGGNRAEPNLFLRGTSPGYFERETDGELVQETLFSSGAAAGDYDGDGYMDLFVANIWGRSSLFHNTRDGGFRRVTDSAAAPESDTSGASSAAWADWDNDGDLDLIVINGQPAALFRNEGNGRFLRLPGLALTGEGQTSSGVVCADLDNDGFQDLLIARRFGRPLLYRGSGSGGFSLVHADPLANHEAGANGIALADYDLDGDLDVLLTNWESQAPPTLFRNQSSSNSWLRIRLVGGPSQRDGIGAVIRVEATLRGIRTTQMRQIGGEDSQGSQEFIAHFGLGDADDVHRVVVNWPSGTIQELLQIPGRQLLIVRESDAPEIVFSPNAGSFTNQVEVTLSSVAPGAIIRYTTDGSEPTLDSATYSGPLTITKTTTVKARLFLNGFPASETLSAQYQADPGVSIIPPGGDFTNSVSVSVATRLPQVVLRYSLDGTEPTEASTAYSGPITLASNATVRVVAYFNGFPVSETVSGTFRRVFVFQDDGIPAAWREQYFGPDFRYDPRAHPSSDPDRDGSDNRQEFLAGSDPLDAASGFRIGYRALPEIRFPTVPGLTYRILRRHSLTDPTATVLQESMATGESMRFVDESPDASPNPSFYLVEPIR